MNEELLGPRQCCLPGQIVIVGESFVSIRLSPDYGKLVSPFSCSAGLFAGLEKVVTFQCNADCVQCAIYDRNWSNKFTLRNTFEPVVNIQLCTKLKLDYPDHQSYLREQISMKIYLANDCIELLCSSNSEVEQGILLANNLIRNRVPEMPPTNFLNDFKPIPSSIWSEGSLWSKILHRPCSTCFTCRPAGIEYNDNTIALFRPVFPSVGECIVSLIVDAICLPVSCIFPANYVLEERGCCFVRRDDGQFLCIVYCKRLCHEQIRSVFEGVTGVSYRVQSFTEHSGDDSSDFKVAVLEVSHLYGTSDVYLGEYRTEFGRRVAEVQSFIELQGAVHAISSSIGNVMHLRSDDQSEDVSYVELAVCSHQNGRLSSEDVDDAVGERNAATIPLVQAAVVDR